MKYLLLILAFMTLMGATTISSGDAGLLHDNDPVIRAS
jgi:hypothetical protein